MPTLPLRSSGIAGYEERVHLNIWVEGGLRNGPLGRQSVRGLGMDALGDFLQDVEHRDAVRGNFLGLLHLVIGRRIQKADGALISDGVTWRTLAGYLKRLRWDKDTVRELGLDPRDLPPRDRERFWYITIAHAGVDSTRATEAGDRLAEALRPLGYLVGPAPGQSR